MALAAHLFVHKHKFPAYRRFSEGKKRSRRIAELFFPFCADSSNAGLQTENRNVSCNSRNHQIRNSLCHRWSLPFPLPQTSRTHGRTDALPVIKFIAHGCAMNVSLAGKPFGVPRPAFLM
jgi:hypothetical protein